MIFEIKLEYDFGNAETGSGAKEQAILWREFFARILMQSEKMVFEENLAFSLVIFCSHAAF